MQEIHDTSVFQKTYDLYKLLHEAVKKYPKCDRYSLGEKTLSRILDIIEAITKAGHAKRDWKVPLIEQAIVSLEITKLLVRLGQDTACLNQKQYVEIQERIQEIGRMLGGWKRSI